MILFDAPFWIVALFLFLFGATIGSFLNVCIHRIPQKDQDGLWASLWGLTHPPSTCPRCQTRIAARDNIPVLGWILLRGRCRTCRMRISIRYPLIELANGLLFVLVYWLEIPADYGASIAESCVYSPLGPQGLPGHSWLSPVAILHWRYAYHIVLIEALIVATFIDFDLMIIPDGVTVPAIAVGLIGGAALGQVHLVPVWFQGEHLISHALPQWARLSTPGSDVPAWIALSPHLHGLAVSLAGFAVGWSVIWIVRFVGHWVLRKEAMGFGDVVLMGMIGSFLGWQSTLIVFFLAPLCALAINGLSWLLSRKREIPYGPYLSLATLILLLRWDAIWPIAERFYVLGPLLLPIAAFAVVALIVSLFLVQGFKWLVGIPLYDDEQLGNEEWTSADQLTHYAGEDDDLYQGRWRPDDRATWPGELAGRGQRPTEQWRRNSTGRK